jgi:pyruvate dehydrogenase E2 component (dihydrolipoamide acetyltransferase)
MAKILDMPKLSPTMEEGVLSAWHKKEGDAVGVDDLLADVETDKATMEFRAFDAGTLLKILVPPGSQVKLGQPVAILGAAGEDVSALVPQAGGAGKPADTGKPAETPKPAEAPSAKPSSESDAEAKAVETPRPMETLAPPAQRAPPVINVLERTSYPAESRAPAGGRVLASPYVRKVARDMGIDLQGAQGSGPGGRVLPADLESIRGAAASRAAPSAPSASLARVAPASPTTTRPLVLDEPEVRPLSPMRRTIARRLTESKATVPHFYLSIDVDVSELVKLRERINAELASSAAPGGKSGDSSGGGAADAPRPLKVSLNDLLIKACAVGLVHVPECNASFTPDAILIHHRVDISVAVAIPDGLVTPVVRRADQKSVVAIAREVRELASRARARKLKPEEMQDGTFSISNLGMFGIDAFSAVINPPEGAILAVGQVRDVPVVADGAVVPGKRLAMTLSCDHRVVDGAVGAAFLAELRRLIENPLRVLTG